jgi:hypothetical protein
MQGVDNNDQYGKRRQVKHGLILLEVVAIPSFATHFREASNMPRRIFSRAEKLGWP